MFFILKKRSPDGNCIATERESFVQRRRSTDGSELRQDQFTTTFTDDHFRIVFSFQFEAIIEQQHRRRRRRNRVIVVEEELDDAVGRTTTTTIRFWSEGRCWKEQFQIDD